MMSRRARFAIHGLAFLAREERGVPISFRRIMDYLRSWSVQLALSESYVSRLFQDLSRAGLVRALPGRRGGYLLARSPGRISMLDILQAVDGAPAEDCCFLAVGECRLQGRCGMFQAMDRARQAFCRELRRESLAKLSRHLALPDARERNRPLRA